MQSLIGNRATGAMLQRNPTSTMTHRTGGMSLIQRETEKQRLQRILEDELTALIDLTATLFKKSQAVLNNLARDTNGIPVMGPMKSLDRVREKAYKKLALVDDDGKKQFGLLDVGANIKNILVQPSFTRILMISKMATTRFSSN